MKVLGLMGSPRKGGNTDILLETALKEASSAGAETLKLDLDELSIAPCSEREYDEVTLEGYPVVRDDIYKVLDAIKWADAVIVASPIFFGSLSAQTKTMIDRFQCVWLAASSGKGHLFKEGKKGAFICAEATDRQDFAEAASVIVRHFFATCRIEYAAELFCKNVESKGKAASRSDCLSRAREIGGTLGREKPGQHVSDE